MTEVNSNQVQDSQMCEACLEDLKYAYRILAGKAA